MELPLTEIRKILEEISLGQTSGIWSKAKFEIPFRQPSRNVKEAVEIRVWSSGETSE